MLAATAAAKDGQARGELVTWAVVSAHYTKLVRTQTALNTDDRSRRDPVWPWKSPIFSERKANAMGARQ